MPKNDAQIIKELEKLFDEEMGHTLSNERDYLDAQVRFVDHCLLVVDEAKRFNHPASEKAVQAQLSRAAKALKALGPEAQDFIEQGYNYVVTDISEPGPIGEMISKLDGYSAGSVRNAQKRRLLSAAQTIWPGKVSKYRPTRFGKFVDLLRQLAGIDEISDDVMRGNLDPDADGYPPRVNPNAI
tara:strand:+ start:1365 stop:1916 length:552 start_codon:yes stop_codon:yes gene_type:complete